jgi:hypothetical protein
MPAIRVDNQASAYTPPGIEHLQGDDEMHARLLISLFLPILLLASPALSAQSDRELREQRNAAQKERQEQKRSRDQQLSDASRAFREYARQHEQSYQERLRALDTEFELKRVQLRADEQRRQVDAEAEYQRKFTGMLMQPQQQDSHQRLEQINKQATQYSAELFAIKREAADIAQGERIAHLKRQHALLKEMDQQILEQARSLGLMKTHTPILASPIGGELTRQEEQWNQRERSEVEKISERNARLLAKYRNGEALRRWERDNTEQDHRLQWAEREELHQLESQQALFNRILLEAASEQPQDPQAFADQIAELSRQQQQIRIKYQQQRQENTIRRREERKQFND